MNTFRKIGIVGGSIVVIFSATVVMAQPTGGTISPTPTPTVAPVGTQFPASREEVLKERKDRMNERAGVRELRATSTEVRAEVKVRVEQSRTNVVEQMEKAKARIAEIKDKAKKSEVERLTTQFDRINKARTEHFAKLLERYSAILKKVEDRATVAIGKGKDVTAATAAIASAKTAIVTAKAVVAAQAAKTYVLNVAGVSSASMATTTSDSQDKLMKGFRTSFKTLHSQLKGDLTTLRDGVMKDARKAVQDAIQTIGKVPKLDDGTTATTTVTN